MRIAVFGTGGVGGYFGARLAAAGHDVHFVARGAHLDAIRRDGLRVESIRGDMHIQPAQATDRPAAIGPVDWILCAVKAWQLPEALAAMPPLCHDAINAISAISATTSTTVLPLQNGVDAAERVAAVLGRARTVAGAAWIRAEILAPGVIGHAGVDPRVVFGELDGAESARTEALRRAFVEAGVRAEVSRQIASVIWTKFAFIAATSAVGAAARVSADVFRAVPATRALVVAAIAEVVAVARARGVPLDPSVVPDTEAFLDSLPPGTTASMQRDILAGRPSELEDQCGTLVRLACEAGVPTPVHTALYGVLLPQELRARAVLPARPAG